jgi:predicted fused transcriptional regulator/phosphomethylpyrimidine kinase
MINKTESNNSEVFNIELDKDTEKTVKRLADVFEFTPEEFIKRIVKKETSWILQQIERENNEFIYEPEYFEGSGFDKLLTNSLSKL